MGDRGDYFKVGAYLDMKFDSKETRHVGLAYFKGNAFYVARKDWESEKDARNTILHEMGHLFGLSHQGYLGDDDFTENNREYPNYKSVMNNLYPDIFNYSEHTSQSTNTLPPVCFLPKKDCYRGNYVIPSDWDNLNFKSTQLENIYATAGVSTSVEEEAKRSPSINTYSRGYTSSETLSNTEMYALTVVLPVFLVSLALTGAALWAKYSLQAH